MIFWTLDGSIHISGKLKLTFGSLGNGSISHLTMAQFLSSAGVTLVNVPF